MPLRTICILCSPQDKHALWLALQLRAREWQVEFILPEELLINSSLQLRISTDNTESIFQNARGVILTHKLNGVINRLYALPPLSCESGNEVDALYLEEEWRAALVAWLAELACPVLNRPTGTSLQGTVRGDAYWRYLAIQIGLTARPWFASSDFGSTECNEQPIQIFVAGKQVIDTQNILSLEARNCVAMLSAISQLQLCCVEFDCSTGEPCLLRLDPLAPFAAGGDALVTAIETMLTSP